MLTEVCCPNCNSFVRKAYLPAVVRCFRCGCVAVIKKDGATDTKTPKKAVCCRKCGKILTGDSTPGAACLCPDCYVWSVLPGDRKGEREAETANRAGDDGPKVLRRGDLPGPVLTEVRKLAVSECANHRSDFCDIKHYCVLEPEPDKVCAFFSAANAAHRCSWFESAVLLLRPELQDAYNREYEAEPFFKRPSLSPDGSMGRAPEKARAKLARQVLREAKKKREKECARCGNPFVAKNSFEKYCSDLCRKTAERDKARERVRKQRAKQG
ncbi:hypothetical protein EDD75_0332 [Thermodesulfitimonas autotrophica]|uniref:Uncharacterized protein n=1 Tax=Thermodesulfitimonas autotrophica TaxID=1894989 RepID=A0A3N5AWB5_9THEO|nr:hypothetical protein [Thermodesulfitimonas autotrophica]RPF49516.1 hypothetical protein EDD75_0332 [Thermodesulfitimonas autotrophica]